jgi:Kef-type K+ transport system membrane component KefB/nucleotide-binding universal stress UspA family protein
MLVFVLQITILLFTARVFGEIAQRKGLPSIVGEIVAGIVLGPSLLSGISPFIAKILVPQSILQQTLLDNISLIGLILLLLITGLEIDLTLIRRHAKTAISVSYGGIIFTLLSGFILGMMLPGFMLGVNSERIVFALFIAVSMSISAIPVLAKVLFDLNLIRRDLGQTILAAGMNDDIVGWILLTIVTGLASGHSLSLHTSINIITSVLLFIIISFPAGRWIAKKALDIVQDRFISRDGLLSLVIILTFSWSVLSKALNLEIAIGAFTMGIIFGQLPRLPVAVIEKLHSMTLAIFAPIFFAVVGLKVNIYTLLEPRLILIALAVILVAIAGKFVGTFIGAKIFARKDTWSALCFGAGLNARGAMEIVVATIGLTTGIISHNMFSIIVLMAITTTLMAPPALSWTFRRISEDKQESERLRKEKLLKDSRISSIHRILLPVREQNPDYDPIQHIKARVLDRWAVKKDLSVTMLCVINHMNKSKSKTMLTELSRIFNQKELIRKIISSDNPADTILDEAKKDYDLLILGASKINRSADLLFTPLVDYLVRFAPCPTLVVHGDYIDVEWSPRTILVPVNGTTYSKHAAEFAFRICGKEPEKVVLLNVILRSMESILHDQREEPLQKDLSISQGIVTELYDLSRSYGVSTTACVREGEDLIKVILEVAEEERADLIILGTNIRAGHDKLYLGPRVEKILKESPCPVIVINT